jgi:hypothetical protein
MLVLWRSEGWLGLPKALSNNELRKPWLLRIRRWLKTKFATLREPEVIARESVDCLSWSTLYGKLVTSEL